MSKKRKHHHYRHPKSRCPVCNHELDCASVPSRLGPARRPKPGDISLCIKCGEALVFGPALQLQQADLHAMAALDPWNRELVGRAQKLIREHRFIK